MPCSLLALSLLGPALAGEPSELDRGWYLAESSRPEQALATAARLLEEDPTDTGAHRLYAWVQIKALREAPAAEALYRAWLELDPEADAARIALANVLRWRNRFPGDWCAEAESLLVQPPGSLEDSYWAQRVLYEIRTVCPGDQEAPRHALMKLGEQLPSARAYGLRYQVQEQPIDDELAAQLQAFYAEQPWRLTYVGNPWALRGPAAERARDSALEAAKGALQSDDPLLVDSARRLFGYADELELQLEAEERLAALDPAWVSNHFEHVDGAQWVIRVEAQESDVLAHARIAGRGKGARAALAITREFEPRIAEDGPERAAYLALMAELYDEAGRPMKALETAGLAWQADPTDPYLANDFAYRAAISGLQLEEALVASQGTMAALPAYDPRGDHSATSYDHWQAELGDHAAAFADTHGWVLYRLGRYDEAAAALRQALLLAREPQAILHLHLGLCYDKLDHSEGALRQLGRGLARADGSEPELEKQAYQRLRDRFEGHRWAPGGLETWIALQAPASDLAREQGPIDGPSFSRADLALGVHRHGEPFPDIAFEQGGRQRTLSEIEGIRVVDLWASWCGPCTHALPELDKLAKSYAARGVTFVALSVDGSAEEAEAHLAEQPLEHMLSGWAGRRAMRQARITGIPKTFLIDAEGVIRAVHSGWDMSRGGDKNSRERIAASIDSLLEANAEPERE
jgi:thiol-disulfide isomerase/thioredoxin